VSWAAGTVYMKWAHIAGDPVSGTAWQLVVALIFIAISLPIFEGPLHVWPVHWWPLFGMLFTGLIGSGLAYFLWFEIIRRIAAMTASLAVLSVPVVGVVGPSHPEEAAPNDYKKLCGSTSISSRRPPFAFGAAAIHARKYPDRSKPRRAFAMSRKR
jgi:hypothetical protein